MPKMPAPTLRDRAHARAALLDERYRAARRALDELGELIEETVVYDLTGDDIAQVAANAVVAAAEPREDRHGNPLPVLGLHSGVELLSHAERVAELLHKFMQHADGGRYQRAA